MRKDMEEEIRSQLLANQEMLAGAEGTGMSWEEKVSLGFRLDKSSVSCMCVIFNASVAKYIWILRIL